MNRKELITVLYIILLVCFFIPFVEWDSFEMSGMNFVLSSHTPDTKYILLLIPISALFFLSKAVKAKNLRYIPISTAILLFIICNTFTSEKGIFQVLDYGFWTIFVTSLLLLFIEPKARQY